MKTHRRLLKKFFVDKFFSCNLFLSLNKVTLELDGIIEVHL